MIDGYFKHKINLFWDRLAFYLVAAKFTPNTVTWLGLALVLINCLLYLLHRNDFLFGFLLAISFSFDALDGAVARITGKSSKYGGYLDAVIDRYQEIAIYITLAYVNQYWLVCFMAITGSLLVSYNKARVAVEVAIDNNKWPDLAERFERIFLICAGLMLTSFVNMPDGFNKSFLYYVILAIAILSHVTAIQRFMRARKILLEK
jgi:phosphatidylglycerophosphate synthase